LDGAGLDRARRWLDDHAGERGYRLVVVRDGRLAYAQHRGIDPDAKLAIASAAKSIYSSVLGIAIAEGKIPSADARVADVYPAMLDVPEGEGPKEGRYAFPKDGAITFRQLISNTSGYMKPGEAPGTVFHYQTYGMNVLTHAVAAAYGLYDVADPEGSPGFQVLIDEKIAQPIGADWRYTLTNFDLHARARLNIFGYYCQMHTRPLDLARVGWLWCNGGRWRDAQIIPADWMAAATRVNPDLKAHGAPEEQQYGYGFWSNEAGVLWSDLPRDGFSANGAGGHYCSVFPSLRLVVVQNPGPYHRARENGTPANGEFLAMVLDAIRA
jgi:CubicO group peptidase (beta-lactamase class C family)